MDNFHAVSSILQIHRSSHERCSIKNAFLKNFAIFTGKHLCWCVEVSSGATLLKTTLTQMFSDEYCEIFKNTYFEEHLRTAASVLLIINLPISIMHLLLIKNMTHVMVSTEKVCRSPQSTFFTNY